MIDLSIVVICLVFNAVFSAYEMAFVTVSKDEMEELVVRRKLLKFKNRPERTLSVIQIGITLVGAIAAAVGGTGAVEELEPYFIQRFDMNETLAEVLAVAFVIVPLTYFSVVFGELVPKTIALRYPRKVLTLGTGIISFIDRFLAPIVTFLEFSTAAILRRLKLTSSENENNMPESIDVSGLPTYHRNYIYNLISVRGRRVEEIMVKWDKVCSLKFSLTDEEVLAKLRATKHSRFPVIDGDVLVGIFHVKEWGERINNFLIPWQSLLGPALEISPDEKILEAFQKMQKGNYHVAVVRNKGHFLGVVTIVDVVQQIMGNIKDDLERNKIMKLLSQRGKMPFRGDHLSP